jgi:hypothetical protein
MGVPLYISDTQCGFKAYRRDVAHRLYGAAFTDGFMFDTEIILRALAEHDTILEFPVLWENDADTRFSPGRGTPRILRELLAIRIGLLRGRTGSSSDPVTARTIGDASATPHAPVQPSGSDERRPQPSAST